jgi:hypothetical protein
MISYVNFVVSLMTLVLLACIRTSCPLPVCNFSLPGKCLLYDETVSLTFRDAEDYCDKFNMSLASTSTRTEIRILSGILGMGNTWLRRKQDANHRLKYHRGSSCSADSCCHFMSGDSIWRLDSCEVKHGVVCESSPFLDSIGKKRDEDSHDEMDIRAMRRGKAIIDQTRLESCASTTSFIIASLPFLVFVTVFSLSACSLIYCYHKMQSKAYNVFQF